MKIDNTLAKATRQKINVRLIFADWSGSGHRRCSINLLNISQNSQESICTTVGVSQLELVDSWRSLVDF